MENVQSNTDAGIIFTAFYAIPSKVISAYFTENNDFIMRGYNHFLFNCSVIELQFVLSVILRHIMLRLAV